MRTIPGGFETRPYVGGGPEGRLGVSPAVVATVGERRVGTRGVISGTLAE